MAYKFAYDDSRKDKDERADEYGEAVLSVVDEADSGNVEKWKEDEISRLSDSDNSEERG